MFRAGRVASINADKHTVQVTFADVGLGEEAMVSGDLPVLVTRPGDYSLPAVGTAVLCAIEPGPEGVGYVLGVLYSDADAPPTTDSARRVVAGDDVRLGDAGAADKVALAPAVEDALTTLKNAVQNAVVVAQDGGASLKATILAALASWPPGVGAENVSAR